MSQVIVTRNTGRLKALYLLNVSHNEFTGSIPPSVANLRQLESLDMSRNKLTGNIPSMLATLPTCDRSIVPVSASNRTSSNPYDWQSIYHVMGPGAGQIPGELSQLTRLEILDLSEPFFFGIRSLRLKPNLSTLVQNLTRLRGLYLDNVLQLQSLQTLDLALTNNLSGSLPDFRINESLQSLLLGNTNFSGRFQWKNTEIHGKIHSPIVH
ncbi:receptor-like protein 12 [Tanacetum coccineum]